MSMMRDEAERRPVPDHDGEENSVWSGGVR